MLRQTLQSDLSKQGKRKGFNVQNADHRESGVGKWSIFRFLLVEYLSRTFFRVTKNFIVAYAKQFHYMMKL